MHIDLRSAPLTFLKGLLMGGADIIPGVSGGTMALIVGVYERLIDALSHAYSVVLSLLRGDLKALRAHWVVIDWGLLIPLLLGIATALVVGAKVIPPLLEAYPMQCSGLFFGLVAASLVIPWRRIERVSGKLVGVAVVAALLAFLLVGLPVTTTDEPGLLRVFASAAVAICAMILPGVSGAFLLKVLGLYEVTLEALNARDAVYILTFMAGAATGLGAFSKLLNWLLQHRHDLTMAALVGLMAGSLRALWPYQEADRSLGLPEAGDPVLSVLVLGALGFAFVLLITWLGQQRIDAARKPTPEPR